MDLCVCHQEWQEFTPLGASAVQVHYGNIYILLSLQSSLYPSPVPLFQGGHAHYSSTNHCSAVASAYRALDRMYESDLNLFYALLSCSFFFFFFV